MEINEQETHTIDMNQPQDPIKEDRDPVADFVKQIEKEESKSDIKDGSQTQAQGPSGEEAKEQAQEGEATTDDSGEKGEEIEVSPKADEEQFSPELSYTFRGKKFDMPEELKGLIDTPEKQEFYTDLFTKAKGLEIVKAEGLKAQENYQSLSRDVDEFLQKTELKDFKGAFEKVGLQKPNLQDLLQGFGYSDRDLIELAYQKASLPPEQLKAQNELMLRDRKIQELEYRQNQFQKSQEQQLENQIYNEFDEVFRDESVRGMAEKFDEKYGKGKFVEEVAARGDYIYRTKGQIIGPKTLVNELIDRYNLGSLVSQPVSQAPISSQQAPRKTKNEIPVIPAIEGSGDSPGERVINSLDDIKALYQQEYGAEL